MSRFGDWLADKMFERGGRKYRGVNLAHDLGVRPATVSDWLNDKKPPSREHVHALAIHFGTTSRHIYEMLDVSPPEGLNDLLEEVMGLVYRLPATDKQKVLKDLREKYGQNHK